jgi:hypothetical protein
MPWQKSIDKLKYSETNNSDGMFNVKRLLCYTTIVKEMPHISGARL